MKAFLIAVVVILAPLFTRYILGLPGPVNLGLWGLGIGAVILFAATRLRVLAGR